MEVIDTRGAGTNRPFASLPMPARDTVMTLRRQAVKDPTRARAAAVAERIRAAWRDRRSLPPGSDPDIEGRLEGLDARIRHLEAALEGLQDALYRQAVREDENLAELRQRTEPGRIAQDLSADARRRGL